MYKKILLPVDVFEMDLSDKAVRHAEFLASADEGEITLLNVLPTAVAQYCAALRLIYVSLKPICARSRRKK